MSKRTKNLKILLIGTKNWFGKWTEYTEDALRELGHEVDSFYYLNQETSLKQKIIDRLKKNSNFRNLYNKVSALKYRLIKKVKSKEYNLIFILKGEELEEDTIAEIANFNIPLACWWVDDPFFYSDATKWYKYIKYFFVFDTFYIKELEKYKIPFIYQLPCAYSDSIYFPGPANEKFRSDLAFVGSYYPPREKLFVSLPAKQYSIKIWGPSWFKNPDMIEFFEKNKGSFQGEELPNYFSSELYRSAGILLNLNHSQTKFDGMNQRMLEIPACEGFQICDYREGFEKYFEDGKEIVYFRNYSEIPELIQKYTKDQKLRKTIAQNARKKVVNEHTFKKRLEYALNKIKESI